MNSGTYSQLSWHQISAFAGALAWLLLLVVLPKEPQTLALITRLLLLAVLVFVPLALGLAERSCSARGAEPLWLALRVQPFAAAITAVAFVLPVGVLAGVLALSWL